MSDERPEWAGPTRLWRPRPLLLLEPLVGELERPTVLCDGPHHVIGDSGGDLRFYLKGDRDLCPNQAGEMRDHLLGDSARVAAHSTLVEHDRAVKASGVGGAVVDDLSSGRAALSTRCGAA